MDTKTKKGEKLNSMKLFLCPVPVKHTSPALTVMMCGIKFVPSEHAFKSPTEAPKIDITDLS